MSPAALPGQGLLGQEELLSVLLLMAFPPPRLIHTAFGPPFPCIVTALGSFTSMQTISLLVVLKQGVFKPEDQK